MRAFQHEHCHAAMVNSGFKLLPTSVAVLPKNSITTGKTVWRGSQQDKT